MRSTGKIVGIVVVNSLLLVLTGLAQADLVGWWKLDETAGTVAKDSSGYGNDGTCQGTIGWTVGKVGGAWQGDGTSSYIRIPHSESLNLSNAVTIAMWVYSTGAPTRQLICKGTGGTAWWSSYSLRMGNTVPATGTRRLNFRGNNTGSHPNLLWSNTDIPTNEWLHIAVTFDIAAPGNNQKIYFNGLLDAENSSSTPLSTNTADLLIGADAYGTTRWWWAGMIDDVRIYNEALPAGLIPVIMAGGSLTPGIAVNPQPADKATDVRRDVILSWQPGAYPCTHDVYLGTSLAEVEAATRDKPGAVLLGKDHTSTSIEPGLLQFGQTYYWRVDEVNTSPDRTIYKGSIWSFTVEPYAYSISPIAATASSSLNQDSGPTKTIDRSGLNTSDQHSTNNSDMWLSDPAQPLPAWIQFQFDNLYMFQKLLAWNSNMAIEPTVGLGAKDVEILYSQDGLSWSSLGSFQFNQAPGNPNYSPNTQIDLAGIIARYIRLNIKTNYSNLINQTGISEIRFFQIPTRAFYPNPPNAATNIPLDATANFRPGRLASSHTIYLASDQTTVANASAPSISTQQHSFNISQFNPLYATTYYWRVDEVNQLANPTTWQGNIWSFTTAQYAVVDDFEAYDDICNRIFFYWTDGLGHSGSKDCGVPAATGNGTGSTVGNINPPFAERTIVNSGRQSMPLAYDNSSAPYYSQTTRLLDPPQDWTKGGVDTLTIYLRGMAPALLEYAPGAMLLNGTGSDIYGTADQGRFVYKQLHGDGSIIARVESLANTNAWAKVGVMIRETLNPDASWAYVLYAGQNGVRFQARLQTAASATSDTPIATTEQMALRVPVWIKLERKGNLFYGYYSTDGTNWTSMAWNPQTIQMPTDVYIGIAITSHAANVVCGAKVTNISTTGNVSGNWQSADLGVAQPIDQGNSPQQVYLVIKDAAGASKQVNHTDPTVIATGAWERWDIPLSTLANINLKAVSSITLGIGNNTNPSPAGKGNLYIDDIRLTRTAAQ